MTPEEIDAAARAVFSDQSLTVKVVVAAIMAQDWLKQGDIAQAISVLSRALDGEEFSPRPGLRLVR